MNLVKVCHGKCFADNWVNEESWGGGFSQRMISLCPSKRDGCKNLNPPQLGSIPNHIYLLSCVRLGALAEDNEGVRAQTRLSPQPPRNQGRLIVL